MVYDRIGELLIGAPLDIAGAIGLDGTTNDEELDALNQFSHSRDIVSGVDSTDCVNAYHETEPSERKTLKRDALGAIVLAACATQRYVVRDTASASYGLGWVARRLMRREQAALDRARGIGGVPVVYTFDGSRLTRSYLPGAAMHLDRFEAAPYFKDALRLLRRLHRRGIAHNDLAKEANWICMPGNRAGIVDFQLAMVSRHRRWLFRALAREDLRHLLKHKQHYAPALITRRQQRLLEQPGGLTLFWRVFVKPPYHFVTRKLLGWPERTDAFERESNGARR